MIDWAQAAADVEARFLADGFRVHKRGLVDLDERGLLRMTDWHLDSVRAYKRLRNYALEEAKKQDPSFAPRRPRGFGAMDPAVVSAIAKKGGIAAHARGTAHEFTSEEARAAGQKGGRVTHAKREDRAATLKSAEGSFRGSYAHEDHAAEPPSEALPPTEES